MKMKNLIFMAKFCILMNKQRLFCLLCYVRNFSFLNSSCVSIDSFLYAQLILYVNDTELMLLCI